MDGVLLTCPLSRVLGGYEYVHETSHGVAHAIDGQICGPKDPALTSFELVIDLVCDPQMVEASGKRHGNNLQTS